MFNNYDLTDKDVMGILSRYDNLINKYSYINGEFSNDLKQYIVAKVYINLTKNREK
ncbi:MAG: helix-turn-helix domain-containing protein [Clostridia bacterium]|nr:helix-turn-helix domain-containing protein [Clostridia bacterium]